VCGTMPLQRLEVTGLTYTYPGSMQGIQGLDLCLERGSFTVVAGPSGAGKTTLLRALLGLLLGVKGEIRWNGAPVPDVLGASALVIGSPVAEPARPFSLPRVAYLSQACSGSEAGLHRELPRVLESDAELLAIDDLSAVLSVRDERVLWDSIFAQRLFRWRGACLSVSNRQPALSRADHIILLTGGKVAGEGKLDALLQNCAEMRCIWKRTVGHAS
jgi:ATP-binding cassette subfamily B protein